ncbi:hypothetical protein H8356DRAFT_1621550 [Neocallimastix lanati (nom. inval.)]|uniref:LysM domain-containing protein n=1 Tax=Neocallimastix californiae TaxID=1754190 RepID=A0A1Y2C9D8_9FUNG|nr:hypothetical protein H8356DRAFT_1621550 [Neocallimastix sp. JGI-2020a]ORY43556.1 hypothetical protein LY90DRAFT_671737 [Neocallimastix californiae]|eukprot:ORY43556.1 hypothetical protein LY90DRAFT_671737 [Neocallimastix californiae]
MKSFFFVVVVGLLTLLKVNGLGYICKEHIVVKHGDRCHLYNDAPDPDYRIKYSEIYNINPNIDCDNLRSGSKICIYIDNETKKGLARYEFEEYKIKKDYDPKKYTCKELAKELGSTVMELEHTNFPLLNCRNFKRNLVIRYKKDGKYTPDFSNSKPIKYDYGKEYSKNLKTNY